MAVPAGDHRADGPPGPVELELAKAVLRSAVKRCEALSLSTTGAAC